MTPAIPAGGGDIDGDPYDGDDDDPRCTHCEGEVWVECDDPIQCCDPRCDGEMHPDPACGGTGLYEHQVIFVAAGGITNGKRGVSSATTTVPARHSCGART